MPSEPSCVCFSAPPHLSARVSGVALTTILAGRGRLDRGARPSAVSSGPVVPVSVPPAHMSLAPSRFNYVSELTAGDGLQLFQLLPAGSGITRR